MNREQRLEMLSRLVEVPSVELKLNVPADQRLRLSGPKLDAMRGRVREVYFFDTPDLTLYGNGLVTGRSHPGTVSPGRGVVITLRG